MPTKVFTILGGVCPFGQMVMIDSLACRNCEFYFRTGTGTFFWCRAGELPEPEREAIPEPKKKRGRPKGSKNKAGKAGTGKKRAFKGRK